MAFLNSLNINGSALTAERFRIDIINQNIASAHITMTPEGTPYRRKLVVFQERPMDFRSQLSSATDKLVTSGKGGVRVTQVVESKEDFVPKYDPSHPDADENGYVLMPNVNQLEEQTDLMQATRAYEANLSALQIGQSMAMKALELLK